MQFFIGVGINNFGKTKKILRLIKMRNVGIVAYSDSIASLVDPEIVPKKGTNMETYVLNISGGFSLSLDVIH